jgi:hypothetical protein
MQNLGNVYIWGFPFVMSRTDAQNRVDIIFNYIIHSTTCEQAHTLALNGYGLIQWQEKAHEPLLPHGVHTQWLKRS